GCLLAEHTGIDLRRVGSGKRRTFSVGEEAISAWMDRHAYVCWAECAEPWQVEEQAIKEILLPGRTQDGRGYAQDRRERGQDGRVRAQVGYGRFEDRYGHAKNDCTKRR